MFFNTQFTILVVDDEPDVLSLTKMLLRDVDINGLPLHVETARSKAEAIEVFNRYNQPGSSQEMISVAFIDVVMETDNAGLELCDYIRNDLDNYITQLFIRTGQPGIAPEREVIDKYDINGYFTKTELDETKLYSLLKSGIRQATTISNTIGNFRTLEAFAAYGGTHEGLEGIIHAVIQAIESSGKSASAEGESIAHVHTVMEFNGQMIGSMAEAEALEHKERLLQLERHPLNEGGDFYTRDDKSYLIYVAPSPMTAECYNYSLGQMEPSSVLLDMLYRLLRSAGALWKQGDGALSPAA
jgi:CheY-like chemotaxis protein